MTGPDGTEGGPPHDPAFVVELEAYSGPLDLLLHLIRDQEIDIYDIPIARVADQFLQAIHRLGLNDAADYLDMAAYLLRIKVQLLLPRPFDEDAWEDPRAELVRRLLEYEQVREVAEWMAARAAEHGGRFPRGWVEELPALPAPPLVADLGELMEAVARVLEGMPQPILHRVVARPLDVEGATARITALLEQHESLTLTEILGETPSIVDVLSGLLALLELARQGRLRITQPQTFGAIAVVRESSRPAA